MLHTSMCDKLPMISCSSRFYCFINNVHIIILCVPVSIILYTYGGGGAVDGSVQSH